MQVSKDLPAIQQRIDTLLSAGFEVRLQHYTDLEEELNGNDIKAETNFVIYNEHTGAYASGRATCSDKDEFCKKIGTQIAFNRTIHALSRNIGRKKVVALFA